MGVFEMVVSVTAIGVAGGVLSAFIKGRSHGPDKAELNALKERIEKLERLDERVQTIETIITDRKDTLKREIDAL